LHRNNPERANTEMLTGVAADVRIMGVFIPLAFDLLLKIILLVFIKMMYEKYKTSSK